LIVEETGVPGRNHIYMVHDKASFYNNGATYLVPQAGIEPLPRTSIGYTCQ
jgi:hypothetical protein